MSTNPLFSEYKDLLTLFVLDFINPTHSEMVSQKLQSFLVNIEDLGSLGLIYLIFVFTMFFQDYEHIINKIHNTKKRNFIPSAFLYISFIIIIPIFLAIFTYISTVLAHTNMQTILNFLFGLIFITLIFMISVNKKVSFKAALISAFLTINVLKFTQFIFVYYVTYNQAISTIYGTLSVIFFMFLWVFISWIIYLYGVKICYLLNKKEEMK